MRVADWTFRRRFLVIGVAALLGFAAVIWIGTKTLADVRIGRERYDAIGADKELDNEVSAPTLYLEPMIFYVLEAAITNSSETRAIALSKYEQAATQYRERMRHWQDRVVDRGLGLRRE